MHVDYAFSLNNIGVTYDNKGDYDKALDYYFRSLDIKKTVLG
jgi:tetratricopeptide (TPR) repeat protein